MTVFAWVADASGSLLWFNRRSCEFTGTTPAQARGWRWLRMPDQEQRARIACSIRQALTTDTDWQDMSSVRGRQDDERWFLSHAVPIRDRQGRAMQWFGTNTDVTEQMAAEETLQHANEALGADRRKSEFLTMLSRELCQLLVPIQNSLSILERSPPGSPQARRAHELMSGQVGHLTRLIDDLLDVTRISGGMIRLRGASVDPGQLLQRTCEDLGGPLSAKDIVLPTGITQTQPRGWRWLRMLDQEHRARVACSIRQALTTDTDWQDLSSVRGRQDDERWFLSHAVPIRDRQGRAMQWFGTNTDVTEQMAAEETLQHASEALGADRRKSEFLTMLSRELCQLLVPIQNSLYILERSPQARRAHELMSGQVGHLTRLIDDLLDVTRISRGMIRLRCESDGSRPSPATCVREQTSN